MESIKTNLNIFFIVFTILICSGRIGAMNQDDTIDIEAKKVISHMLNRETFQIKDILRIQKTDGLVKNICNEIRGLPPPKIEQCLYGLDGLSVVCIEDQNKGRITYGGYYNSKAIVGLFVDLLFIQESELGSKACAILATPGHFPDSLIRDYNEKIISAAQMYPKTPHIVRLLGVTGTDSAKTLIKSKVVGDLPDIVTAALAKLGDMKAQDQLIERYKNAVPGREKEEFALLLGYVNSVKSVLALASDFRSEQTYIWHEPSAERSMRVDIVKGLHVAFPEEPIFWKPAYKPTDDTYYDELENWLKKHLDVKWDKKRPPFLYEIEAPF